MAEALDDSILNADSSEPNVEEHLDEAQIADLLADPDEVPQAAEDDVNMVEEDAPEAAAEAPDDEGFDEVDPEDAEREEEAPGEVEDVEEDETAAGVIDGAPELFQQLLEVMQKNGFPENCGEDVVISDDEVQIYEDNGGGADELSIIDDPMDAGEGTSSSSRKRTTNGHGPPSKRQRSGRVFPFFEARRAAMDLVTRTLGSWDALLTVPHLRLLKDMNLDKFKQIHEIQKKTIDELARENTKLKQELEREKKEHGAAVQVIKTFGAKMEGMRKRIDELSIMVTQPRCITIFDDVPPSQERKDENAREMARMDDMESKYGPSTSTAPPMHRQQQAMQPHRRQQMVSTAQQQQQMQHRQQQIQQQPRYNDYQVQPPVRRVSSVRSTLTTSHRPGFQGAPIVLPDGSLPSYRGRTAQQAAALLARAGLVQPAPQPMRPQFMPPISGTNPNAPRWAPIPTPVGMGHLEGSMEPRGPQPLIDNTKPNENTIKLLIPFVPSAAIISTGDSSRLPRPPPCYSQKSANPDLTVTITSSHQDFRENWQIGGRINYEYLSCLEDTTIQIYIQVASLKFNGMNGCTHPDTHPIDWGISQSWPCKMKSQKFRILFHQKQLLPVNDRIMVMVVAKNALQGTTEISAPVFMTLE